MAHSVWVLKICILIDYGYIPVTIGIAGSSSLRATRSNLGRAELDCRTVFAMTNKKPQNE